MMEGVKVLFVFVLVATLPVFKSPLIVAQQTTTSPPEETEKSLDTTVQSTDSETVFFAVTQTTTQMPSSVQTSEVPQVGYPSGTASSRSLSIREPSQIAAVEEEPGRERIDPEIGLNVVEVHNILNESKVDVHSNATKASVSIKPDILDLPPSKKMTKSQKLAIWSKWRDVLGTVEEAEELDMWDPPPFVKRSFPFYLAGYDFENRPIWVAEYGKFPLRQFVENGQHLLVEKYLKYFILKVIQTIPEQTRGEESPESGETNEVILILDFEGHNLHQISHPPTIVFILKICKLYTEFVQKVLGSAYIINADYMANTLINLVRPILGRVLDKTEVYGTQREKWMSVFRRTFPPEAIPSWYGGAPGFQPVRL